MSTITEIGTVIVPASDQDEALELYVGTLGFEVRIDGVYGNGERWLEVAPPGAVTTIALVPSDAANGIEVSFTTRDAEADHSEMRAKEIDADAEVMYMGDYVPPMFTFRDPDGNRFRMVQRNGRCRQPPRRFAPRRRV